MNVIKTSLAIGAFVLAGSAQASHWNYESGHDGPRHWADLDAAFAECGIGKEQSPINIARTEKADLPSLQFAYAPEKPSIVNNGHTIQVNVEPGSKLHVGEHQYELLQFHFHTPSEEAINGQHAAMVIHFVHKDESGKLGVVALLLDVGKENKTLAPVFAHLPRPSESLTVEGLTLDLSPLLQTAHGYYAFAGSLTTPPCSEDVSWMVLKTHATISTEQFKAFQHFYKHNARPVQPLNGRVVKEV